MQPDPYGNPNPHSDPLPPLPSPDGYNGATAKPAAAPQQSQHQPVAYDQHGRPLYAHPPSQAPQGQAQMYPPQQGYNYPGQAPTDGHSGHPQMVYMARPHEPVRPPISEEVQQRAEASQRQFPQLNMSDGEYVISAVKRHPIGVLQIWAVVAIMMLVFGGMYFYMFVGGESSSSFATLFGDPEQSRVIGLALLVVLYVLFLVGGFIATYIYNSNRFYLTNESVIQEIRTSLFSANEQTVSLANIEDASYVQHGIIQTLFGYGSIRLSTEGDETTYRFTYVTDPKKHIATLNNAVEAFKNGRPVEDS